jgi:hypothetical protein
MNSWDFSSTDFSLWVFCCKGRRKSKIHRLKWALKKSKMLSFRAKRGISLPCKSKETERFLGEERASE